TAVRFTATSRPEIYPLSLHDALPISRNSWEFAEFSVWTATPNSEKRSSFSAAASCSGRPSNVSNLIWVGMGFCAVSMVEKRVEADIAANSRKRRILEFTGGNRSGRSGEAHGTYDP